MSSGNGKGQADPRPPRAPVMGVLEWFRVGERERVQRVLSRLKRLGVAELRTGLSWADWVTPEGKDWYDWLIPTLRQQVRVLPCCLYTPPSLGVVAKTSAPPRDPKAYADFIDVVISRYGDHFEWLELWNEPNNLAEWDWTLDPDWLGFCKMIGMAAYWARRCGKKTVLAGVSPPDPTWLELIGTRNVLQHIDAVGVHGFPGTWEKAWFGWEYEARRLREVIDRYNPSAQLWITEVGYSTWRHDHRRQLETFLDAARAPVDRVYWYAAEDLDPDASTVLGFHHDEREYHFGLYTAAGQPKLLARALEAGGVEGVRRFAELHTAPAARTARRRASRAGGGAGGAGGAGATLITGGAGFIGTNLADRILSDGKPVIIYDNLSRPGVEANAAWLKEKHGDLVDVRVEDVRDRWALREALGDASSVFHFAAQVAVTTSLDDPVDDHGVNVGGAINILEEIRRRGEPAPLIFTSTNKVYGCLEHVELVEREKRYEPADPDLAVHGVSELQPLDFRSPYGCSKGAADQYILDYAKSYGLPTAIFRMSCIYGPHQWGTEDQGWIAHFLRAASAGRPLTIYGDGKQVRDALFVEDLVQAFLLARRDIGLVAGRAFNIGGGPRNTLSLLELLEIIAELEGQRPPVSFSEWRVGDQRWYVSDTRAFEEATGWRPTTGLAKGARRLHAWLMKAALTNGGDAAPGAFRIPMVSAR